MPKLPATPSPYADDPLAAQAGTPQRPTATESAAEVAVYIGHMARDLAALARSAKLGALAYLLEMTEAEASTAAEKRN